MLRLVLEATAAVGYIICCIYHASDILDLPLPFIGLAWVLAVRFKPSFVPSIVFFWVTYSFIVYQLISIHDLNACVLEDCHTSKVYSCIAVGSTCLFWFSMSDKSSPRKTPALVSKPTAVEKDIFPALKIKVQADVKRSAPVRLKIGDSIQPKWV